MLRCWDLLEGGCGWIELATGIWAGRCWEEWLSIEFATEIWAGQCWEECVGIELATAIWAGIDFTTEVSWAGMGRAGPGWAALALG